MVDGRVDIFDGRVVFEDLDAMEDRIIFGRVAEGRVDIEPFVDFELRGFVDCGTRIFLSGGSFIGDKGALVVVGEIIFKPVRVIAFERGWGDKLNSGFLLNG